MSRRNASPLTGEAVWQVGFPLLAESPLFRRCGSPGGSLCRSVMLRSSQAQPHGGRPLFPVPSPLSPPLRPLFVSGTNQRPCSDCHRKRGRPSWTVQGNEDPPHRRARQPQAGAKSQQTVASANLAGRQTLPLRRTNAGNGSAPPIEWLAFVGYANRGRELASHAGGYWLILLAIASSFVLGIRPLTAIPLPR